MTEQELEKLPEFAKSCTETDGPLLIHQDGFAADYNE